MNRETRSAATQDDWSRPKARGWHLLVAMVADQYDVRCTRCHRRIRTVSSVSSGMGPVCRGREES